MFNPKSEFQKQMLEFIDFHKETLKRDDLTEEERTEAQRKLDKCEWALVQSKSMR